MFCLQISVTIFTGFEPKTTDFIKTRYDLNLFSLKIRQEDLLEGSRLNVILV